jgi:hypothetical protein
MTEPMTKFFNVKDARVGFEKRDDFVLKLYHPDHGVFRVADVDAHARATVYFYKGTKIHEVFADECIYNYSAEDSKVESWQTQTMTQEQLDVCIKVADAIHGLLQAAKQDKDNVELLALWVSDEASHLSEYIRECLNEGENK